LILIGTSPARQLPTIRSRSQIVRFEPLDCPAVARILTETGAVTDPLQAAKVAQLSGGSVERALELSDPAMWQFRQQLLTALRSPSLDRVRLGRALQAFVDEAGKEASLRRDRLRCVINCAVESYRAEFRRSSGSECANEWVESAEPIIQAIDRCLAAIEQVDRNANLGLVIQAWCEGLAPLSPSAPRAILTADQA
jgi:DNA polymerase-3 subunit delta'